MATGVPTKTAAKGGSVCSSIRRFGLPRTINPAVRPDLLGARSVFAGTLDPASELTFRDQLQEAKKRLAFFRSHLLLDSLVGGYPGLD
jgi:hypothetical protein